MEDLIKISQFLDGYRTRQVDIIGNEDSESRYSEFFNLLKDGTLKTDHEAVKYFYGEKATDRNQSYRRFKSTFKDRLINTLFFIDINHAHLSDLETATMNIHKEWAAINILFAKGEMRLPTQLAERLLPTAIKFELTEIVVYITDRLKNSYGGQIGDSKKYAYYKRLQKEHMSIWQAEIQAKELYQDLRMHYIKSNAYKPYVSEIAKQGLEELGLALEKYKTSRFIFFVYIAKIAQYTSVNDYKTASTLADEAIAVFREKPYDAQRLINTFLNQKLTCHIQLREYEQGQTVITETLAVQVEGTLGWFKTLEHATTLAFHTKKYAEAYDFYRQAKAHPQFMTLELRHLEIWHLYKAYLYFLIAAGKVEGVTLRSAEFDDFRMGRFLNDVIIFGRDSAGMNISILIIQLALNLLEGKFGKVIDSIDALTKFRQRHVSKSNVLYRHNLFIKMVSKIPRSGFGRQTAKRLTEVPYRNLKNAPIMTDGQSFQSEIIPLEDMWDILVNMLKNEQ